MDCRETVSRENQRIRADPPDTPEGFQGTRVVSPNGAWTVVRGPDRRHDLYPISGGRPTVIPGIDSNDFVAQINADGLGLYAYHRGDIPLKVYRVEISTGRKTLWRTLMPADAAGVSLISPVMTPSGESYAYSCFRTLSDLYLLDAPN